MRNSAFCRRKLSTGRSSVYDGGKSRIYYGMLYCNRAGVRDIFAQEDWREGMDCGGSFINRPVPFMHYRETDHWILVFLCALVFTMHILVIDYFSPKVDGVKMSCIQFFVCGLLSLAPMFALETPQIAAIIKSWGPILYAGVLSSGVAYTLQIVGQKNVNPAIASLILSLESCFSVLAGWIILGQRLSGREAMGCVLMFAAIILAQLPDRRNAE